MLVGECLLSHDFTNTSLTPQVGNSSWVFITGSAVTYNMGYIAANPSTTQTNLRYSFSDTGRNYTSFDLLIRPVIQSATINNGVPWSVPLYSLWFVNSSNETSTFTIRTSGDGGLSAAGSLALVYERRDASQNIIASDTAYFNSTQSAVLNIFPIFSYSHETASIKNYNLVSCSLANIQNLGRCTAINLYLGGAKEVAVNGPELTASYIDTFASTDAFGYIWVFGWFLRNSGPNLSPTQFIGYENAELITAPVRWDEMGSGWKKALTSARNSYLLHTNKKMYGWGYYVLNIVSFNQQSVSAPYLLQDGVDDFWATGDDTYTQGFVIRKGTNYYNLGSHNGINNMTVDWSFANSPTLITSLSGLDIVWISGCYGSHTAVTSDGRLFVCAPNAYGNSAMMHDVTWYANGFNDGEFHQVAPEILWSPNSEGLEGYEKGVLAASMTGQLYVGSENDASSNWASDFVGYPTNVDGGPVLIGYPWPTISTTRKAFSQFTAGNWLYCYVSNDGKLYYHFGNHTPAVQFGSDKDWLGFPRVNDNNGDGAILALKGSAGNLSLYRIMYGSLLSTVTVEPLFTHAIVPDILQGQGVGGYGPYSSGPYASYTAGVEWALMMVDKAPPLPPFTGPAPVWWTDITAANEQNGVVPYIPQSTGFKEVALAMQPTYYFDFENITDVHRTLDNTTPYTTDLIQNANAYADVWSNTDPSIVLETGPIGTALGSATGFWPGCSLTPTQVDIDMLFTEFSVVKVARTDFQQAGYFDVFFDLRINTAEMGTGNLKMFFDFYANDPAVLGAVFNTYYQYTDLIGTGTSQDIRSDNVTYDTMPLMTGYHIYVFTIKVTSGVGESIVYVDSVEVSRCTLDLSTFTPERIATVNPSKHHFEIAADSGFVDDLVIFDRCLTPTEVASLVLPGV